MLEKVKSATTYILGLITLILGAVLFAQRRKNESLESELAQEKANDAIKDNEKDRQAAREHADSLVDEYERIRGDDR